MIDHLDQQKPDKFDNVSEKQPDPRPTNKTPTKPPLRNTARNRIFQIVGVAVLVLICLLVWKFFGDRSQNAVSKPRGDVAPVETAVASQRDVPIQIKSIGNIEPLSTVSIRSQVEGTLQAVHFQPGDEVKKGDLLFSIDPRPLQSALAQAQANLVKSMAAVTQGRDIVQKDAATARNLRTIAKRDATLVEQGVISREEYDNAVSAAEAAEAAVRSDESAVATLQAAVKAEQANVENARVQLSYTSIRSPIQGKTGNLAITAGNLIPANNQTPLVTITQTNPIYVTFAVPEPDLMRIRQYAEKEGFKTEAIIPGDESNHANGRLSLVDNTVDVTTGTVRLKATFDNNDRRLYPGQFVNVVLTLGTQDSATVVPSQAVQIGQDSSYVYVVKQDMTAEVRNVKTGTVLDNMTVIEDGLKPGEQVVTDGQLRLVPGIRVQISGQSGNRVNRASGGSNGSGNGGGGSNAGTAGANNGTTGGGKPISNQAVNQ